MNKKILLGLVAVFVISIVSLGIVMAYRGTPNVEGPNYDADVHEQLEAAMEAGDYDTWVQIRTDNNLPMRGRMFQVINADNFDRYVEMHEANEAGDVETANAIRAELGLGQGMRQGNGQGRMVHSGTGSGQNQGTGLGKNFVDANSDGLCDSCGKARD